MPLGFVNALAKNESAMQKFAQMEKDEKEIVLEKKRTMFHQTGNAKPNQQHRLITKDGLSTAFFSLKIIYKFELLSKRFS